jgi:hypothetical protein
LIASGREHFRNITQDKKIKRDEGYYPNGVCVCVCAIFAEVETGSQRYGREDEENKGGKYKYASRRCEK